MKALVYHGPNNLALEDKPNPVIYPTVDAAVYAATQAQIVFEEQGLDVPPGVRHPSQRR